MGFPIDSNRDGGGAGGGREGGDDGGGGEGSVAGWHVRPPSKLQ